MDFLPIPLLRILSKSNWCLVIWLNDSKKFKRKENNMVKNIKKRLESEVKEFLTFKIKYSDQFFASNQIVFS